MNDNYPRVLPRLAASGPDVWEGFVSGPLKVVPADAIVIERGELPEVTESATKPGWVNAGPYGGDLRGDALDRRAWALAYLAADEYLAAQPPIDQEQVKAMDRDLDRIIGDVGHNSPDLARRLVEQGWTKPAVES